MQFRKFYWFMVLPLKSLFNYSMRFYFVRISEFVLFHLLSTLMLTFFPYALWNLFPCRFWKLIPMFFIIYFEVLPIIFSWRFLINDTYYPFENFMRFCFPFFHFQLSWIIDSILRTLTSMVSAIAHLFFLVNPYSSFNFIRLFLSTICFCWNVRRSLSAFFNSWLIFSISLFNYIKTLHYFAIISCSCVFILFHFS